MSSIPVLVPLSYITLLVGALYTFSRVYRKRTVARIARLEPWFPSHPERDVYISLLQLSPQPSDVLLKAALLRRAAADVRRIVTFREDKAALQALLQKGSIGDDLWNAFLAAEKELEAEIVEVVNEANSFKEGWGQFIFNSASEVVNNVKQRDMVLQMPKLRAEAEAKYGTQPSPFKMIAGPLVPPTLITPAPSTSNSVTNLASPATKNAVLNGRSSPAQSASTTAVPSPASNKLELDNSSVGTSSPSPSANGELAGTSSPRSKSIKTPGSASKGKKRK